MSTLLNRLRDALLPTCDVPGCDEEPVVLDGGIGWLCSEHLVEYLVRREKAGDGGGPT